MRCIIIIFDIIIVICIMATLLTILFIYLHISYERGKTTDRVKKINEDLDKYYQQRNEGYRNDGRDEEQSSRSRSH